MAAGPWGRDAYAYDAAGNRTARRRRARARRRRRGAYGRNPAGQVWYRYGGSPAYEAGRAAGYTGSTVDGLNRLATVDGAATAHDGRGNLTALPGGRSFAFDPENNLTGAAGGHAWLDDPLGRLLYSNAPLPRWHQWAGEQLIADTDLGSPLVRERHGDGGHDALFRPALAVRFGGRVERGRLLGLGPG